MIALWPVWPYSRGWGYRPAGSAGILLLFFLFLIWFAWIPWWD